MISERSLLCSCSHNAPLLEPDQEFKEKDFPRYYKLPTRSMTDNEIIAFEDSIGGKLVLAESKSSIKKKYSISTIRWYYPLVDHFDHASLFMVYDMKNNMAIFHYYIFEDTVGSKSSVIQTFVLFEKRSSYWYPNPEIAYMSKIKYVRSQWLKVLRNDYKYEQSITPSKSTTEDFIKEGLIPELAQSPSHEFSNKKFESYEGYPKIYGDRVLLFFHTSKLGISFPDLDISFSEKITYLKVILNREDSYLDPLSIWK